MASHQVYRCVVIFVIVVSLSRKATLQTTDLTEDPEAIGSVVVSATIARLDYMFSRRTVFPDGSDLWKPTQSYFMRVLAFVESLDGNLIDELDGNSQEFAGIWRTNSMQLGSALNDDSFLQKYENDSIKAFGDSLMEVLRDRDNLKKPVYSAMGVRLILLHMSHSLQGQSTCGFDMFPTVRSSPSEITTFWLNCYRSISQIQINESEFRHRIQKVPNGRLISGYPLLYTQLI